ncbi:LOW QUALITY PROTEIN: hypothetical protein Cgig2_030616 [Carnegiea gigantea]|uniref:Uncharacterized protein n=1 Tax=Carnegiea gigantea TaxID=171969 RepID=A0A9Q1K6J1_9CARY|nr:LOW QUALITY PROTEIN: hypothetical protein Cgig2_030616 [Carnegiea gigantea]
MSWMRESLTAESALMKLAEGREASAARVAAPAVFEGAGCSCRLGYVPPMTGSPIGEGPTTWLSPPPLTMGQKPQPHLTVPQSSASSEPIGSQQASFRRVQRRAPTRKKLSLCIPRETKGGVTSRVLPLLLPLAFGIGRHLFGSGVPSLKNRQPHPRLICIKQTGSRVSTKHKTITGLAPPLLGPLHRFNCLSHEIRDRPRLIILAYIELEVAVLRSSVVGSPKGFRPGFPSFQSGTSPKPDAWRGKRKSYFQCFTLDFFSIAVMKPDLLVNQYRPKSLVSLGALCTGRPVNRYTLGGGSFTVAFASGITKEYSAFLAPGNFDPSATISVTVGVRPFHLSTNLPGSKDASEEEELVDALFEDELLEEGLEEEPDKPVPEEALELVEATSASGLGLCHSANLEVRHIISYGDLPRIRHLHLRAKNVGGGGILTVGPRGSARLKKEQGIGNLFGFPILILSGDASHHPAINKGREVRELWVPALHLGAG